MKNSISFYSTVFYSTYILSSSLVRVLLSTFRVLASSVKTGLQMCLITYQVTFTNEI